MINYLLFFTIPLIISLLVTPLFRRYALNHHVVALQNHRTVHTGEVPKLGGGAIFVAFLAGLTLFYFVRADLFSENANLLISLAAGAAVLFFMGAIDDKTDLNCNLKLAIEILVALLAVSMGWKMDVLIVPAMQEIPLGIFAWPFSVLWIVGVANSFNMIDGLDGLAAGIAIAVLLSSMAISALFGGVLIPVIAIILAGALFGFLRYNINPASIFMGDSGSLSLGFALACVTMNASTMESGKTVFLVPLLLLGLPLTDTTLAIFRRWRRGIHPFHADREHVHHRLVNLGLSQSGSALTLVGLSVILGIMAYLVAQGIRMDMKLFQ